MSVPFAIAWQRLVKTRYTAPAREHAKRMRQEAERVVGGPIDVLSVGATHIERLANMLDELSRPVADRPIQNAEELRAWLLQDIQANPGEWRAVLGR